MWVSSAYNFYFNGMMEPHMIDNYIYYVFVYEFNHVGFICVSIVLPVRIR